MCLQDWQINRRLTAAPQEANDNVALPPNALRVALHVTLTDAVGPVVVYWGPDRDGVPLGVLAGAGNASPYLHLSLAQVGPLITGPLFVDNPGGFQIGVTELIGSPALEELFQGHRPHP